MKFVCLALVAICLVKAEETESPRTVTLEEADKTVDTSEQHDPMFQGMGGISPYTMFGAGLNGYGPQENGCFVHAFNFIVFPTCPINLQVPTDANAAAQQQIQQLQDQIRRLNEQVRRSQQGQSNFEQFAQILSAADGLDCNCSGSSAPFSNFPYGGNSNSMNGINQMSGGGPMGQGFGQQMPFMAGRAGMMGQRIFPGMFP
ncbi:hypothetical protein M3Y97_00723400 [Aphelenchoides bicaudatus]|nr:hypothetical protein M3Y97_00723400 [Aphelenchoides bicaudatus]